MKKLASMLCLAFCILLFGAFYSCSRKEELLTLNSNQPSSLDNQELDTTTNTDIGSSKVSIDEIYVHICGAVVMPNVYKISEDTRLFDLIQLAGGLTENAAGDAVNQASLLEDGQKVYIPTKEEVDSSSLYMDESNKGADGLININTATKEELMSLPGIGESKAKSIMDYRTTNGEFNSTDDIKLIAGIKDSVYNKISDKIKVK